MWDGVHTRTVRVVHPVTVLTGPLDHCVTGSTRATVACVWGYTADLEFDKQV